MTERHLLVVHAAADPSVYTKKLGALGFRLSLIKKRPSDVDRLAFQHVVDCDYQLGATGFLAKVDAIQRADPLDGVLSFSESGVIPVSLAAQHLGLPGNTMSAALRARNKFLMRRAFSDAGLAGPKVALVRSAADIFAHLQAWGGEAVLKPLSGSSSYGVVRLSAGDSRTKVKEVFTAVTRYVAEYRRLNPAYPFEFWLPDASYGVDPADDHDPATSFLLESFIAGQQVSVDGIVSGPEVSCFGVIEIERIADPRFFLEAESWMPTRFGRAMDKQIQDVAARAARAIGLTCSGFHCELKVAGEQITVIEIAARRGADNVADFVFNTSAVDVYEEAARLACGEHRVHPAASAKCAMGMRYFLPSSSGRLDRVEGLQLTRQDHRVSELVIDFEPGALVEAPPDGYEFLGYLSVKGKTRDEVERSLDELCDRVRFHIVPAEEYAMEAAV